VTIIGAGRPDFPKQMNKNAGRDVFVSLETRILKRNATSGKTFFQLLSETKKDTKKKRAPKVYVPGINAVVMTMSHSAHNVR
jgi:malic enzyme